MARVGDKLSFEFQGFHRLISFLGECGVGGFELVQLLTRREDGTDAGAEFYTVKRFGDVIARAEF